MPSDPRLTTTYALISKRDRVYCGLRIHRVGRSGKDCTIRYCLVRPRKDPASLDPQGDLFTQAGTLANGKNLENVVPAQGSCLQAAENTADYDQAGTCKNLLSTSACRESEPTETPIIGTRASAYARTRSAGEKAPGGSCQNADSPATTEYNCELSTGTSPGEVPAPSATTDAPPWDHLPVEPGDIDLADFDDEEVGQ